MGIGLMGLCIHGNWSDRTMYSWELVSDRTMYSCELE